MNLAILQGNLTKDPDLRYTPSGTAVCNVSLATNSRFKNKQGETQEKTQFHNLILWAGQAETLGKYGCTGQKLLVRGEIEYRSYDDRDGNKKYITEIIVREFEFLSPGKATRESPKGQPESQEPPFNPDDDIPF